jgi:stress response protein SCP2
LVLSLVKGQKIDLTSNNPALHFIHIGLDWHVQNNLDIDVSAFMIGQDEKIVREEDFVFYGQPSSSNGSVRLEESISTIEKQHFIIDLKNIPTDIQKVDFTLTIYESELNGHSFKDVNNIQLRVVNSLHQEEIATFPIDYSFTKESAIVLGSLYRYSGAWKFHAVGSGFYGGLSDLCIEYGVEIDEKPYEEPQNYVQTVSPNQRFQIVQEKERNITSEDIPSPSAEYVQLKRAQIIQFSNERIETLSRQSDILINLFNEQDEDDLHPNVQRIPTTSSIYVPTFIETNQEEATAFIKSLSDVEKSFLLLTDKGFLSIEKAMAFLKEKGLMLAFFINSINENACKYLGDNLLELSPESVIVFDEFHYLVSRIKEGVTNEH